MSPKYIKFNNQDYKKIFMQCARNGVNFCDETFPHADSSLWRIKPPVEGRIVWKRCKELTSNPRLVIFENDQLNPDIAQGAIGNCWLAEALGVLAAHPHLLQKIIPQWEKQDWIHSEEPGKKLGIYHFRDTGRHPGIFRFRFYRYGQWIEVVVDDYLPTVNGQLIYSRSKNPDEMWRSLVEKAYAKLCGCYEALEAGSASDALVDLTGTVPEIMDISREEGGILSKMSDEDFGIYMNIAYKNGGLMSCSINVDEGDRPEERLPNGLVIGHAYCITGLRRVTVSWFRNKEVLLVKLRNPWGEVEWNGSWSNRSPIWETVNFHTRNKLKGEVTQRGDFWMAFEDFIYNFSTLVICRHLNTSLFSFKKRWHSVMFRGEWSEGTDTLGGCINNVETFYKNPQYVITVKKPTVVIVALMQDDQRMERLEAFKYLTIGYVCLKVEENRKYRIHEPTYDVTGQVTYLNAREVTGRLELKCGRYILIPSTYDPGKEGVYFMRLFSSRHLGIGLLTRDAPKKKWWYPIVYFRKSYFVGLVRVQVSSANLNKAGGGKTYIQLTFSDMKERNRQSVRVLSTSCNKGTINFGSEYVFYVRDPVHSSLQLRLCKSKLFGKDDFLGETFVPLEKYTGKGGVWTITKTLIKTVKSHGPPGAVPGTIPGAIPDAIPGAVTTEEYQPSTNEARVRKETLSFADSSSTELRSGTSKPTRKRAKRPVKRLVHVNAGEVQIRVSYSKGFLA